MVSEEDKALFRRAVQSIKPEKDSEPSRCGAQSTVMIYCLSNYYTETVQSDTFLSWSCPGIPAKRFLELKQGRIPFTAKLDLHGRQISEASQDLTDFIHQQPGQKSRCVLIIHGKGGREGEAPVLKNLVNHWLPQIPDVLAFCSAQSRHGGSGAVYVLLKRSSKE